MKNENIPEKAIFCHFVKIFVAVLQLKIKTVIFIAKIWLSKNGFSVTISAQRRVVFRDRNMDLDRWWLCRS
jgi:hypothetical protein